MILALLITLVLVAAYIIKNGAWFDTEFWVYTLLVTTVSFLMSFFISMLSPITCDIKYTPCLAQEPCLMTLNNESYYVAPQGASYIYYATASDGTAEMHVVDASLTKIKIDPKARPSVITYRASYGNSFLHRFVFDIPLSNKWVIILPDKSLISYQFTKTEL